MIANTSQSDFKRSIRPSLSNQLCWIPCTIKPNPDNPNKAIKKPALRGWQHSIDSLDECLTKCERNPDHRPGLSLNPEVNKVVVGDWDNVKRGDIFTPEALSMVSATNTLTEISQSGRGIHAVMTADINEDYKTKYALNYGNFELLYKKHFVAFTFDYNLNLNLPDVLTHYEHLPNVLPIIEVKDKAYSDYTNVEGDLFYGNAPKYDITEKPFDGIMEQLRRAKNNSKSSKLIQGSYIYNGEWLGSELYPTQSEADLALVALCMFYAKSQHFLSRYYSNLDDYDLRGLAYSLSDMVLKKSSLFRSKWRRRDYKISTLSRGYDSQIRTYFDEQSRDEFSDTQRARQGLSANKRMANNQRKILDAIDTLSKSMDKVTQSAIVSHTGISINAVRRNLLALDFDLSHLSPIH